jgi:ribokinase
VSRIVSLGSVNADFEMRVDRAVPDGGTLLGRDLVRVSGGKAANVAVLAARLGAAVSLIACVGDDDLAEQALSGPRAAGVDVTGVRRASVATGYTSIVVGPDAEKTILFVLGANDEWAEDAGAVAREIGHAPHDALLVADLEIPRAVVSAALHAARDAGLVIVLDPAPPERFDDDLLPLVDHLTPDHREAETLTGVTIDGDGGALRAARDLRDRGAGAVYVKLADGGCAVVCDDGEILVRTPHVDAVDKTGAGDAFAGALGWALLAGNKPFDAAVVAVAASTCAVTAYASQQAYPSLEVLDAMRARVTVAQPAR